MQHKLTLALAESCTCGLAAAQLASAEGVSDVLLGSVVTYHAQAKQKLLGVRRATLYSAECQQTTNEMALGLRTHLPQADVCGTVTGLCGPGASATPEKPVGTGVRHHLARRPGPRIPYAATCPRWRCATPAGRGLYLPRAGRAAGPAPGYGP